MHTPTLPQWRVFDLLYKDLFCPINHLVGTTQVKNDVKIDHRPSIIGRPVAGDKAEKHVTLCVQCIS